MIDTISKTYKISRRIYKNGKRTLDDTLREKAYNSLKQELFEQGIDIDTIHHDEIDKLITLRVNEMKKDLKKYAIGGAVAFFISPFIGF